jgi:hypothetical protein
MWHEICHIPDWKMWHILCDNLRLEGVRCLRSWGVLMSNQRGRASSQLWMRVRELDGSTDFLLYLAKVGSDRLTLSQAAFFMAAARSDAAGRPATRSSLLQTYCDVFRGSIRNSYRQLLPPSRLYPKGLGWLDTEPNPNDDREQFLRLTKKGKSVIECVLMALESTSLKAA